MSKSIEWRGIQWRPLQAVKWIIIHCSATRPSQDVSAEEIERWHKGRGFWAIGYHYVIRRDGGIEKGRPDTIPGAHVNGVNHISLGICMAGGVTEKNVNVAENNFTREQWLSLVELVDRLKSEHPSARVIGHRDVPGVAKACPSFDVLDWYEKEFGPQA